MAPIDLGGIASWLLAAALGLGILWAIGEGYLNAFYQLGDFSIPMESLGLIIFIAALGLGAFYFFTDVRRKF